MSRKEWAAALLKERHLHLEVMENTAKDAAGVVADWQVERFYKHRDASYYLFLRGEKLASLWAGQAMWEVANFLDSAMVDRRAVRAGRKSVSKADQANKRKVDVASALHEDWQRRADKKWKQRQHQDKGLAAIARLIAREGENWDTIRRIIKKPVIAGRAD